MSTPGQEKEWQKQVTVNPPNAVNFYEIENDDKTPGLQGQIAVVNNSGSAIMFKVKTTSQESYYVRPNLGVVEPKQSRSV